MRATEMHELGINNKEYSLLDRRGPLLGIQNYYITVIARPFPR